MREEVRDTERLEHMLEAMSRLLDYKEHHTLEEAKANPIIYFGLVKHVEIIGEAVYKLTLQYRAEHPEVNWGDIERMRHVLVHGYYKIRPEQLWETIVVDITQLKPVISRLLDEKRQKSDDIQEE